MLRLAGVLAVDVTATKAVSAFITGPGPPIALAMIRMGLVGLVVAFAVSFPVASTLTRLVSAVVHSISMSPSKGDPSSRYGRATSWYVLDCGCKGSVERLMAC